MERNTIKIPIEKCFSKLDQSFNRVKYFSCITDSLNSAALTGEWVIKNKHGINYAIEAIPKDKENYLIMGYKHFIQSCSQVVK